MVDRNQVIKKLNNVVDPEINVPITDMELVDDITIEKDGTVSVTFHFTTPYCPPVFAYKIALDIRSNISSLEGVKRVKVFLKDHFLADKINEEINKEEKI
jgi:metal-sulfur cluster biosynthetic enzyme